VDRSQKPGILHESKEAEPYTSLLLALFDFIMHHRPGRSMGKSDALSHQADHGSGANDNKDIILSYSLQTCLRLEL
jgi:hypothetical protein